MRLLGPFKKVPGELLMKPDLQHTSQKHKHKHVTYTFDHLNSGHDLMSIWTQTNQSWGHVKVTEDMGQRIGFGATSLSMLNFKINREKLSILHTCSLGLVIDFT